MGTDFRRGEAGTDGNSPIEGRAPGVAYSGGPQPQQQGLMGRLAQEAKRKWGNLFTRGQQNLRGKCGPIANEDCADVSEAFLTTVFSNFHVNTAPRTNLAPPWNARAIDPIPSGGVVTVNTQTFVTVNSFTVPKGMVGIISALGQAANTPSAFGDTVWRIVMAGGATIATNAGQAVNPWNALAGIQHFDYLHPTVLAAPIKVFGGQGGTTVAWQVQVSTAAATYQVAARLVGWLYFPLASVGDQIGSAIAE